MQRKTFLVLATLAVAIVAAPTAIAAPGEKDKEKLTNVKLLAFNDFHGHLEANTPGSISVGGSPSPGAGTITPVGVRGGRVPRDAHEGARPRSRTPTSSGPAT